MRKVELTALQSKQLTWEALNEDVEPTMDALGHAASGGAGDVRAELLDRGEQGRVLILDNAALAKRAATALARKLGSDVRVFQVVATSGGKQNRFRTEAFVATSQGELKPAEGKELDLENPEGWTGDLDEQAHQVLDAFAEFDYGAKQYGTRSFRKRKAGKPSTPRVAALLSSLQKSRAHEFVPQPDGRFELRIELAAGGKQRSFCNAAEADELKTLVGG